MRLRAERILLVAALMLAVGGCDDHHDARKGSSASRARMAAMLVSAPAPAPSAIADGTARQQKLAYSHDMTVRVPPSTLARHFDHLRDSCLGDEVSGCTLIRASIRHDLTGGRPSAEIEVRLPHKAVPAFLAEARKALPGEPVQDVSVTEQSTSAEDLTQASGDVARRIQQLTDYRARLEVLEGRSNARTEDLIRIAHELSQVQTELDDAQSRDKDLNQRIDTELVTVSYESIEPEAGPSSPLVEAWHHARENFTESCASVLTFVVETVPWVPIVLIAGAVLRLALRRWKWRPWRKSGGPSRG